LLVIKPSLVELVRN